MSKFPLAEWNLSISLKRHHFLAVFAALAVFIAVGAVAFAPSKQRLPADTEAAGKIIVNTDGSRDYILT